MGYCSTVKASLGIKIQLLKLVPQVRPNNLKIVSRLMIEGREHDLNMNYCDIEEYYPFCECSIPETKDYLPKSLKNLT